MDRALEGLVLRMVVSVTAGLVWLAVVGFTLRHILVRAVSD